MKKPKWLTDWHRMVFDNDMPKDRNGFNVAAGGFESEKIVFDKPPFRYPISFRNEKLEPENGVYINISEGVKALSRWITEKTEEEVLTVFSKLPESAKIKLRKALE